MSTLWWRRSEPGNILRSLWRQSRRRGGATDSDFDRDSPPSSTSGSLLSRTKDVFLKTWYLGLTSFGGPYVHFQIFHRIFVDHPKPWMDEQTYQELFALCQALPGPASTKMGVCISLLRGGLIPAALEFFTWSLPGALAMFAISYGISDISSTMPAPVYALLSGLNAAVVGIIALSATQLAAKSITDQVTRIIVILSACAGLCYSALWYFPLLMVAGGSTTFIWDMWARNFVSKLKRGLVGRRPSRPDAAAIIEEDTEGTSYVMADRPTSLRSKRSRLSERPLATEPELEAPEATDLIEITRTISESTKRITQVIPVKVGLTIIVGFFASFIAIMLAQRLVPNAPLELSLFRNMYLAGTIIFGGGPVVIPLLREYVVQPGWVSPRDFLIGLAVIQAFPGPNFNFAVYLGALTMTSVSRPPIVGAILGFVGIFFPGLTLALGFQSIWTVLRSRPSVSATLRGINAAAVGLVFTAVYRLWETGYLTPQEESGLSLGSEAWWVVVAAVAYSGSAWFSVQTWISILAGGVLGLLWYVAVKPW